MKGDEHDDEHLSSFRKRKKLKKSSQPLLYCNLTTATITKMVRHENCLSIAPTGILCRIKIILINITNP